jgi:EAL domain-containing protein (putative c-di-GMP-specific phosphodiesterase class I)
VTQAGPASIVRAIIAMSHSLDLEVLAEGVEEEAQRKVLLEQRCDHAQGFLFGRPMPGEEFAKGLSRIDLRAAG